jgi:methylamine dehydrogenase heavy chain
VARSAIATAALLALLALAAAAEVPLEQPGRSETLAQPPGAHWIFVADPLLRRSALLDLDRGEFLGMVSTGYLSLAAVFPRAAGFFLWPETYYSRGSRGERTDVVSFYDAATLSATAEVEIPPKRALNVLPTGNAALSDDDRFLAVFNMTPATSLSIVDVAERRFAGEIETPGCGLVYAAGPRRFLMLCSDGAALELTLDERGRARAKRRTPRFFDPETDPVTEKAVRHGDHWLFVSFEGLVHPVDVAGETPTFAEPWPLVPAAERAESWRIGGIQHLAVHERTGRLFALMHRGGADTHKDPGREVWIYDLARRERVERLALRHPGYSLLSETIELPYAGLWNFLLDSVIPHPGLTGIQVTQDERPLLVTGAMLGGSLAVYDATSLELLRRVPSGNFTSHVLQAPWGGAAR